MLFSKITIATQLDAAGADRFAHRMEVAYMIAAVGVAAAGVAGLVYVIRWW